MDFEYESLYAFDIYEYLTKTYIFPINHKNLIFSRLKESIKNLFNIIPPEYWNTTPSLLFGNCKYNQDLSLMEALCFGDLDELNKRLGHFKEYHEVINNINLIIKHLQS